MSVLINGMAMPQNCNECRLMEIIDREDGTLRYICIAHLNEIVNLKERLDTCPLVELPDHGDLIDRDALIRDTEKRCCADCDKRKGKKKNGKYGFIYAIGEAPCRSCGVDDMVDELEYAKVIIPAERGEG